MFYIALQKDNLYTLLSSSLLASKAALCVDFQLIVSKTLQPHQNLYMSVFHIAQLLLQTLPRAVVDAKHVQTSLIYLPTHSLPLPELSSMWKTIFALFF